MSRGPGKTQRFVLQRLRELREQGDLRHHSAHSLAAAMTGAADPTKSTVQSVRQAIRRLAEQGAIETAPIYGSVQGRPDTVKEFDRYGRRRRYPHYYPPPDRLMLGARLPLTEEQAAEEEKMGRAYGALLDAMRAR
jgi:ribosomal protein L19E